MQGEHLDLEAHSISKVARLKIEGSGSENLALRILSAPLALILQHS
jgi:hypothetical protein